MAYSNQINVSIENGFIRIVNSTSGNEEFINLDYITSVQEEYFDFTAINAYSPGKNEYNKVYNVVLRINDGLTDSVFKFDLNNVDNQAGWTLNAAGLTQAVDDIKNWTSGQGMEEVTVASLNLATASATTNTDILFSSNDPWSMQFAWTGVNAVDPTIILQASNDGTNFDTLSVFSTITLSTASGSSSVEKDDFPYKYIRIKVTKNTATAGTLTTKFLR